MWLHTRSYDPSLLTGKGGRRSPALILYDYSKNPNNGKAADLLQGLFHEFPFYHIFFLAKKHKTSSADSSHCLRLLFYLLKETD